MRIEYSDLALKMMRERNIQPAEVIYSLQHPDSVYPNRLGNRIIYKAHVEGRFIKVKIVANRSPIKVTTVEDSE